MAELIAKSIFILTLCGAVVVYSKIIIETLSDRNNSIDLLKGKKVH